MRVEPYLFLDGACEEALNFYRDALGAEIVMMMRFGERPESEDAMPIPPGAENKIMHAAIRIGDSLIMASDGNCTGKAKIEGVALSVSVDTAAEAKRIFAALSTGGTVQMPMAETFFSPCFGMTTDRFGVFWMVIADAA